MVTTDRRQGRRIYFSSPAKLQCLLSGRYMAGRICNISTTGALLEVDRPSLLVSGQRLAVGVAWNHQQCLIRAQDLVNGTVIRSLGLGRIQHVAIQFDKPMSFPNIGWAEDNEPFPGQPRTAAL